MSKYDIYAVDAALVDTEIVVDDAFLANNNIDKGVITLVDESRQAEILAAVEDANHHVKKVVAVLLVTLSLPQVNLVQSVFILQKLPKM